MSETYPHSNEELARAWNEGSFKSVVSMVRASIIEDWENTAPEQSDTRENLWQQLHALAEIAGRYAEGALQDEIDKSKEDA